MPQKLNIKLAFGLMTFMVLLLVQSCEEERIPIPKPRIYPKVIYPQRNYVPFDKNYCAFTFDYPDYMQFEQDSLLINQKTKHPCWFTMQIPSLQASVHFTYTDISGDSLEYKLFDVIEDSYTLTEKHNIKASGRKVEPFIDKERKLYGYEYQVYGDVASPYHFVLSDSLSHALWVSLYFNANPNEDSLAPIKNFVKEDLQKLIQSFSWQE